MTGYLSWVFGLAGLLGLVLTIVNFFPKHALIRNFFTIFCLGALISSLFGGVRTINVSLPTSSISSGILLFYVASLLGFGILLIAAVSTGDKEKRERFLSMVGTGFSLLLFSGMMILFFSCMILYAPTQTVSPGK